MRKELEKFDKDREIIIKRSRDILKDSKRAIYSVHREDLKEAANLIKKAESEISKLKAIIKKNPLLDSVHAFNAGLQEYAEAACYFGFVKNKKIPTKKQLKIGAEDYLMGICDLTGELGRRAVNLSVKKKYNEVLKIRELVDDIYGEFLKFNLRNSELRKKSDSIKWNLKKIEDIVYDLKTKGLLK